MSLLIFAFFAILIAGVPVFIALALSALLYTNLIAGIPDFVVLHRMAGGIDSFPLLAVPFFILAGNLMNSAGITNRIYDFAVALVAWMRGGLAQVNIIGSVIFAGMSGTAIADAAGLGTIEIKAMKDHGYQTEFAVGVTAASATLGPIIPPSLPFVIYGMMANTSIGALFLGGIIPGGLMALLMMAYVWYYARRHGIGADQAFRWRVLGDTFVAALPALMTPALIIGGMTFGFFTPTEAAIAACVWALFLGLVFFPVIGQLETIGVTSGQALLAMTVLLAVSLLRVPLGWATVLQAIGQVFMFCMAACIALFLFFTFVLRIKSAVAPLKFRQIYKVSLDTIETTAAVLLIVGAASLFGWVLTTTRVTEQAAAAFLSITRDPLLLLILMNVIMLIVGCFLEPVAAISILVPVLMPIIEQVGINPVHFGIVMVLNLMIGLLHPPLGMVLFVLARIANLSVERTTMAILPWLVPLIVALALVTAFPEITLWLPRQAGMVR